jgi:hypothetical protein
MMVIRKEDEAQVKEKLRAVLDRLKNKPNVTKEELEAELDREGVPWRAEVSEEMRELLDQAAKVSGPPCRNQPPLCPVVGSLSINLVDQRLPFLAEPSLLPILAATSWCGLPLRAS